MSPVPPYDIIIFLVMWSFAAITWGLSFLCQDKDFCVGCLPDNTKCNAICGQSSSSPPPTKKSDNATQPQMMMLKNSETTKVELTSSDSTAIHAPCAFTLCGLPPGASLTIARRVVVVAFSTFVIAFILTVVIMAILAGVGFLDVLLFAPAAESSCVASCTSVDTRQDGLSGWVDESCCTYSPTGLPDTFYDVFLRLRDTDDSSLSTFTLHGWLLFNATRHYSAPSTQRPLVILYNHGSGGNIASGYRIERYKFLLQQGNVVIFVFDYPGYGKSTGFASTASLTISAKGAAAYVAKYLASFTSETDLANLTYQQQSLTSSSSSSVVFFGSRHVLLGASMSDPLIVDLPANNGGVDLSGIVVLGRSLGGGVSIYLATHQTSIMPKAMLIQSTFSKLSDLMANYFPMFYWVWIPTVNTNYGEFSNVDNIGKYENKCLYHSHSKDDEWVPFVEAEEINTAATGHANCSMWVAVSGAIHTQPLTVIEQQTLGEFLKSNNVH